MKQSRNQSFVMEFKKGEMFLILLRFSISDIVISDPLVLFHRAAGQCSQHMIVRIQMRF